MSDTPNKTLDTINKITVVLPLAIGLFETIKKAIESGNGSMTVDQLVADAESGWDKAQQDLDALAKKGHEADAPK